MKCLVLLSGGVDSATALHWAKREHTVLAALSFDYGSNHAARELACARYQAEALGIPYRCIDLISLASHLSSALLSGPAAVPTGEYSEENMRRTVVPFRNGIFLAVAAGVAESCRARGIVIAAHAGDHAVYPDCREPFMQAMQQAISLGTYARLHVLRPFIQMNKGDIIALGTRLGVSYAHTYSCYCGGAEHCGLCATCRERKAAFAAACVPDPTHYIA